MNKWYEQIDPGDRIQVSKSVYIRNLGVAFLPSDELYFVDVFNTTNHLGSPLEYYVIRSGKAIDTFLLTEEDMNSHFEPFTMEDYKRDITFTPKASPLIPLPDEVYSLSRKCEIISCTREGQPYKDRIGQTVEISNARGFLCKEGWGSFEVGTDASFLNQDLKDTDEKN